MRLRVAVLALVTCAVGVIDSPVFGQEHAAEAEATEEEFHRNHLSVLAGGTTEPVEGASSTSFSLGLDYERRISRLVGVAAGGELVFGGEEREALIGAYLLLHATAGLVFAAGPGLEFAQDAHESGTETHPGLRVGVLYQFEVGRRYTIAPSLYTDFIEGKEPTFVWGLSFGAGF